MPSSELLLFERFRFDKVTDASFSFDRGGGACQLREKVLAEAATHFIIVADSRKDSKVLGTNWKQGVPVEVAPFAWAKVFQSESNISYFRSISSGF